jgi:hypothetical protein
MQGDGYDTEGRGYQRFDTHAQAVVWTNRELFKDALLAEIDRLRDLIEDA